MICDFATKAFMENTMSKTEGKEQDLKVSPSDKKDDKNDTKSKARLLIMNHPEVLYNAKNLFHNENGKTIIEESVPRGDAKSDSIMPRNQGDLTDSDLRELAVYASSMVDDIIAQYDQKVAYEDALQRAIGSKDSGKYAGKISASTFTLILDQMGKKKQASEETFQPVNNKESSKEDRMDKELIQKEIAATVKKLAALEVLACDCSVEKEAKAKAEMIKCPTCDTNVLKATGYCLRCKKKIGGADKKDEDKKEEKKEASSEKTSMESILASLDEIAGALENQKDFDLFKIAYQIDMVSDVISGKKEAATLESDPDEKYMREFFKAGLREGDSDEKSFMGEFNTDTSKELSDKYPKGLGKDASELPYKVVK
jgi:hypothetical protein